MNMKIATNRFRIIIGLIIFALAGLTVIQITLLVNTYEQKEKAFSQNVMAALGNISQKMVATEALTLAITSKDSVSISASAHFFEIDTSIADRDTLITKGIFISDSCMSPVSIDSGILHYNVRSPQRVKLQVFDPIKGESRVLIDTVKEAGEYQFELNKNEYDEGSFLWKLNTDSVEIMVQIEDGATAGVVEGHRSLFNENLLRKALENLEINEYRSIEERLKPEEIDSLLKYNLHEAGIDLDFNWGVIYQDGDSTGLTNDSTAIDRLISSPYKLKLFQFDPFSRKTEMALFFPDQTTFLWTRASHLIIPTILLMAIIIWCFVYTIRTVFNQKRFSNLLVDFINNMTHEFKTPISTVQLAVEAIRRDDVIKDQTKVRQFSQMILNENQRMKQQTDKILQMAVLEEGDYEIKITDVDLHRVISDAVNAMKLQVENRQGTLAMSLQADPCRLHADQVHLANIIHNLLDNANKYSLEQPHIEIRTANTPEGLVVEVSDNGIGMKPEDAKMACDKYFRVPSGNIHNVKGFGLGLSYVRLMMQAHGGQISLESEYTKGTTVRLLFPPSRIIERDE